MEKWQEEHTFKVKTLEEEDITIKLPLMEYRPGSKNLSYYSWLARRKAEELKDEAKEIMIIDTLKEQVVKWFRWEKREVVEYINVNIKKRYKLKVLEAPRSFNLMPIGFRGSDRLDYYTGEARKQVARLENGHVVGVIDNKTGKVVKRFRKEGGVVKEKPISKKHV